MTATISELTSTSLRTISCRSTFADGLTILAWRSNGLRLTSKLQPTKCNDDNFRKRFSLHVGKHHMGVVLIATALLPSAHSCILPTNNLPPQCYRILLPKPASGRHLHFLIDFRAMS
jgi:hypothetical protein